MVQSIGLPGIVISTIVSIVLINVPWGGWVLFKYYFESKNKFVVYLVKTVLYFLMMCLVTTATWGICYMLPDNNRILFFGLKVIICVVVPTALLLLINCKNSEFKPAIALLLNVVPAKIIPNSLKEWINK